MNTTATRETSPGYDLDASVEALQREGITGLKSAFSREWAEAMREDMMTAFWSAIQRPGGALRSISTRPIGGGQKKGPTRKKPADPESGLSDAELNRLGKDHHDF